MFSSKELNRYSRQILMDEIGFNGQLKLRNARVLVVGAGGLGCPVLQYLAAAGVGNIGIIDSDLVDETNLHRQILYDAADILKPKAETAAKKIAEINPYINIQVFNERFSKENALEIISDYDFAIDCTDNFPTRFLLNDACVIQDKPFVFGGVHKFEGQVSVFNYKNGPTYRCFIPEEPQNPEGLSCAEVGIIGVVPGIIGCLQANEALKIILNKDEVLSGKLLCIDFLSYNIDQLEIKKNTQIGKIKELGEYSEWNCLTPDNDFDISVHELKKMIIEGRDIKIIDIREQKDFDALHIESSTNIPLQKIISGEFMFPIKGTNVIVCNSGRKSIQLIKHFNSELGYSNLLNLKGGIIEWLKQRDEHIKLK